MTKSQSAGEEIANSITTGIGTALSIAALIVLVVLAVRRGDPWRVVSFSIYGTTLVFLYLASTLYHSISSRRAKNIFHILDRASIYLLIAGTYTPVTLISMRGPWGWALFGLIWIMAIGGVVCTASVWRQNKIIPVLVYVGMGWLILFAFEPMLQMTPRGLVIWFLIGGACYTLGLVFYVWKRVPYQHMIWHLFVLGGTAAHFVGFLRYLT